jgi:site-specific recombinase XerD
MLLDQFATQCWSFLPVTKKTISNYKGAYNRNISHHFGSRDMNAVSKREFLDVLAPLMPPNYFQTLMMLRVLYREALSRELVTESPVASIRVPRTRVPIAKALEPYGVTIHSLRKTYAYFLKSNNVHVTTAAKFMGHSNPLVTLKIYTLVRDDEINLVGDGLRRVLTSGPAHLRDTSDTLTQSHLAM